MSTVFIMKYINWRSHCSQIEICSGYLFAMIIIFAANTFNGSVESILTYGSEWWEMAVVDNKKG